MIRLCICGGREYFNRERIYDTLSDIHRNKPFILISGGQTGADTIGIRWAVDNDVPCEIYPADWKRFGNAAGPIRNQKMLDSGIDILIAFKGGVGTENMISICTKAGVPVFRIKEYSDKKIHEGE